RTLMKRNIDMGHLPFHPALKSIESGFPEGRNAGPPHLGRGVPRKLRRRRARKGSPATQGESPCPLSAERVHGTAGRLRVLPFPSAAGRRGPPHALRKTLIKRPFAAVLWRRGIRPPDSRVISSVLYPTELAAGGEGFEPPTPGLSARCSTVELTA